MLPSLMIGGISTEMTAANSEILEYEESGECPSCGARNDNVSVTTHTQSQQGKWDVVSREITANIQTRYIVRNRGACENCGAPEKYEHLHRTCLICTYNWSEEVKPEPEEA